MGANMKGVDLALKPMGTQITTAIDATDGLDRWGFAGRRLIDNLDGLATGSVVARIMNIDSMTPGLRSLERALARLAGASEPFASLQQTLSATSATQTLTARRAEHAMTALSAQVAASTRAATITTSLGVDQHTFKAVRSITEVPSGLSEMHSRLRQSALSVSAVGVGVEADALTSFRGIIGPIAVAHYPDFSEALRTVDWNLAGLRPLRGPRPQEWIESLTRDYARFQIVPPALTLRTRYAAQLGAHLASDVTQIDQILSGIVVPAPRNAPATSITDAEVAAALQDLLPGYEETPLSEPSAEPIPQNGLDGQVSQDALNALSRLNMLYPALNAAGFRLLKSAGWHAAAIGTALTAEHGWERTSPGLFMQADHWLTNHQIALTLYGLFAWFIITVRRQDQDGES